MMTTEILPSHHLLLLQLMMILQPHQAGAWCRASARGVSVSHTHNIVLRRRTLQLGSGASFGVQGLEIDGMAWMVPPAARRIHWAPSKRRSCTRATWPVSDAAADVLRSDGRAQTR
jgi:hypothetical protein